MAVVRIGDEIDHRLTALAKKTHRSKSYYVQRALQQFLEDQEDYIAALAVLEQKNRTYSLEEAKKILGLDQENE